MADLGTLGGTSSQGFAINASGQVTGNSDRTGSAARHAFRYTGTPGNGGSMADLGTLGGADSFGLGLNAFGQVVGYSYATGDTAAHAFLYTGTPGNGGAMVDLGTLGSSPSSGNAINDAGQVVGSSWTTGHAALHAFLYTGTPGVDGQMIDLDVWLDANNPTEGAKWTLAEALGISNTGWIVGTGSFDPDGPGGVDAADRAFLLDASSLVPEPNTLGIVGLCGTLFTARRSRRR
jgi:probable HAF family extracellular repeat protein